MKLQVKITKDLYQLILKSIFIGRTVLKTCVKSAKNVKIQLSFLLIVAIVVPLKVNVILKNNII